jgi:hypothetical protein
MFVRLHKPPVFLYFRKKKETTQKRRLMQTKGTIIDFNGQNVYAGIDIHLKAGK